MGKRKRRQSEIGGERNGSSKEKVRSCFASWSCKRCHEKCVNSIKRPPFGRCGQRDNCSYVVASNIIIPFVSKVYSVTILLT